MKNNAWRPNYWALIFAWSLLFVLIYIIENYFVK